MAKEELQFILSAKDNASPVFSKVGKNASKSLGDVEKQATKAGTSASTGFGASFKKGLGSLNLFDPKFLAVGAVTAGVKFAINAASSLQEATSKSQAVFRENADEIEKWADTASKSFGQSKASALEAAGTFGNLFQAFGVGLRPATEMSRTLTELASDLASFNNTSVQEAIEALRSGLSGETEPLKRYGVALTDARLKQEALGLGLISDVKKPLDAAAKSQAAYSLIMKDTALAQGDFDRTSDGYANTMRTLQATVEDAAAEIGTNLLPSVAKLAKGASQAIGPIADLVGMLGQLDTEGGLFGEWTGIKVDFQAESWGQMITTIDKVKASFTDLSKIKIEAPVIDFAGLQAGTVHAGGWGRALDAAAQASMRATTSADTYARSVGHETEALRAANDALYAHMNAQLAVYDSTFAVTDAQNRFTVAAFAANSTVDDASTVLNEQTLAQDEAAQAALGAAAAAVRQADDQAKLEGSTLSAKDATAIQIITLTSLAQKIGGPVAAEIMGMVDDLKTLDKTNADPDATVNDQTAAPMKAVNDRVTALDGRTATISVNVLTGGALNSINAIQNAFNRLPKNFTGAAPPIRKQGGPIPGSPNQPVPILAHGGEYVLSADVVDRIKRGDASRGASASLSIPTGGGSGGSTVINFNGTFLASKAELGRMVDEAVAESRRRGNRAA